MKKNARRQNQKPGGKLICGVNILKCHRKKKASKEKYRWYPDVGSETMERSTKKWEKKRQE